MGTELIDRRIRKTRKQLKDCLISLLKTKAYTGYHRPGADGNGRLKPRNLYLHYKDVFDLLEQTETGAPWKIKLCDPKAPG